MRTAGRWHLSTLGGYFVDALCPEAAAVLLISAVLLKKFGQLLNNHYFRALKCVEMPISHSSVEMPISLSVEILLSQYV